MSLIWVQSLGQEESLEEGMQHTPVFLPGEPHGQEEPGGLVIGLYRVGYN